MDTKGVLLDNSKKEYKGTIDFKKGSKDSEGNENESVILLSEDAKNVSIPILLCNEDDVRGSHAASAGRIDDKKMFYLKSRGFSEIEAKKIIIKASFSKIIEKIGDVKLQNRIFEEIDRRII